MPHAPSPRWLTNVLALPLFLLLFLAASGELAAALNAQEQAIADLMVNDAQQGRPTMTLDPILARVARERAADLANRNYFSHTNPDGNGPNYLVTQAGYVLPSWWGNGRADNFIESIAGGTTTPAATWSGWMNSSGHRTHILARDPFYVDQTSYGVGYYYNANSTYRHYWVILTAPPNTGSNTTVPPVAVSPLNDSSFVSRNVPATMLPGQSHSVSVEFVNTGTATWTAGQYQLGSQAPADNGFWGVNRVTLPGNVAPGGNAVFHFTITAPATEGTFECRWQMVSSSAGFFGEESGRFSVVVSLPGLPTNPPPAPAPAPRRGQQTTPQATPAPAPRRR